MSLSGLKRRSASFQAKDAGNMAKGMGNHQSSTLLFDPAMGHAVGQASANYIIDIRPGAMRVRNLTRVIGWDVDAENAARRWQTVRP